jgi:hypothetical protein
MVARSAILTAVTDFVLVELPEPRRRCLTCARFGRDPGLVQHQAWHPPSSPATHLPIRWRVIRPTDGLSLAPETQLVVIATNHQYFPDWDGADSVDWLLEVEGGPDSGSIYVGLTWADHPPDGSGLPPLVGALTHPLWPDGLEPVWDDSQKP